MKNVIRQNTAYQNALADRQNANTGIASSLQDAQTLKYNQQMADLAQESIDTQRSYNAANTVLKVADLALNYGSKIYDVVQQSQASAVSNDVSISMQEGQRLLQNSIANGTTYFGTNATTGEAELIMAPEVENWYNSVREKISNGKYMSSVRDNALQSFDLGYEALKTSANSTLVEKYYSDLNSNFATGLELAKQADIQSYVQAGGDIDTWNANSTIQGVKSINSRTDWSSDAKSAQITSYLLEVQQEGDTQIAANIAKTQGLQSALDYIESKPYYTTTEKQKMFASASTAATYAKTAAAEEAKGFMEDALINSTATPEQVYSALEDRYSGSSPAIQAAAKDAATLAQTEIVQNKITNQLTADSQKGIDAVYDTYTSIKSGAWDDQFYGVESIKNNALSSYSSKISDYEEEIAKSTTSERKAIDESNKTAFTQYQKMQEINLSNFDSGTITGTEYVANEISYANSLASSLKEGGDTDVSYWTDQATSLSVAAIQKISDMYIPKRYQSAVDDALDTIKVMLGNNVSSTKTTPEIAQSIYNSNLEFTGHVADFIKENGATMTDEEFSSWISKEASNYVLLQTKNKTYSLIQSGKAVKDETVMSKINSEFKDVVGMAYETPTASSYLVSLGTDFVTGEKRYTFASDEAEETWASMATTAKTQVKWLTGISEEDMVVLLDNTTGSGTAFAPLVTVNDGSFRCFKFDGKGNIYESVKGKTDEEGNTIWRDTGIDMTTSVEAMTKQKLKAGYSLSTSDQNASVTASLNSVSSEASEEPVNAEAWANKHKLASPGMVYQYLKTLDDNELDEAVDTLKERVDKDGFLMEAFNDPKRALDVYLEKIKGERW